MSLEGARRGFSVILERGSPKPDAEIGRLLSYHLDLHPTDAIVRVRYGGGLIADDVPEELADHLVQRLRDIGVQSRRIESDLWGLMPRGFRAFGLELGDPDLLVRLVGGRKIAIPRPEIFAVHVYGLLEAQDLSGEEKKKREALVGNAEAVSWAMRGAELAASSGPDAAAAIASRPREAGDLSPRGQQLLDRIVEAGAAGMDLHVAILSASHGPVRARKRDFDFSCLGEQRQQHSLDNFLFLLEAVLAYLPAAWNRESAERFLEDLDPKRILYFKEEEALNLERWIYQWARIEGEENRAREPS